MKIVDWRKNNEFRKSRDTLPLGSYTYCFLYKNFFLSLDVVYLCSVLQHLSDTEQMIRNITHFFIIYNKTHIFEYYISPLDLFHVYKNRALLKGRPGITCPMWYISWTCHIKVRADMAIGSGFPPACLSGNCGHTIQIRAASF